MSRTAERRAFGRVGSRLRAFAAVLALVIAATGGVVADPVPAIAADYPTWDEVQKAKADTAAAAKAVDQIIGLIAQLEENVAVARAEAERRTEELLVAQQQYDDAVRRADEIQAQADSAAAEAADAERNAGQLAAQLYRTGGTDLGVNLMLDAGESARTDELLAKLGSMEKLVERTADIYAEAKESTNTAQSLADQAEVARAEREKLRIAAEEALAAAQAAQAAAEAALAESEARKIELDQQLKFLKDTEAKTTAAYQEGERKRKEEEERRRKAEEERRRREAEAAAAGGGGGSGGGGAGAPSSSGWSKPAYGYISGNYGPREVICSGGYCSNPFHYATDIATGCSAPIYAAYSGTVVYAGWSGSYGNYLKIDHGGGIYTGYAHIRDGGLFVGYGQWVSSGQVIASSGTTGASTGCHLHFEVYNGWSRIDPVPFMAARGVYLG
ncbi:M23 family metallopeptidase [Agromyces aurantiacus]|uniref:M23 family metallopeptidase n=1 Tax=Agromyces aurantiacus TaxID=165814 RepID=A0ABV9R0M1_9MICO|nr:M23 family metallopeptidase [Agromyces aurantiacus]MBM7505795.1 murein DD-endopeptidase MepM/ murein hydrolase activator NlpD [Agromyces aurantiacus]